MTTLSPKLLHGRTPTDGKPFYCAKCGCGLDEYLACEMPDCELEPVSVANKRKATRKAKRDV